MKQLKLCGGQKSFTLDRLKPLQALRLKKKVWQPIIPSLAALGRLVEGKDIQDVLKGNIDIAGLFPALSEAFQGVFLADDDLSLVLEVFKHVKSDEIGAYLTTEQAINDAFDGWENEILILVWEFMSYNGFFPSLATGFVENLKNGTSQNLKEILAT